MNLGEKNLFALQCSTATLLTTFQIRFVSFSTNFEIKT